MSTEKKRDMESTLSLKWIIYCFCVHVLYDHVEGTSLDVLCLKGRTCTRVPRALTHKANSVNCWEANKITCWKTELSDTCSVLTLYVLCRDEMHISKCKRNVFNGSTPKKGKSNVYQSVVRKLVYDSVQHDHTTHHNVKYVWEWWFTEVMAYSYAGNVNVNCTHHGITKVHADLMKNHACMLFMAKI